MYRRDSESCGLTEQLLLPWKDTEIVQGTSPLQASDTKCRPRRLTGLCRSGSLLSGSEGSRWSRRMQLSLKEVLPAGTRLTHAIDIPVESPHLSGACVWYLGRSDPAVQVG